jgi:hypothetical protein
MLMRRFQYQLEVADKSHYSRRTYIVSHYSHNFKSVCKTPYVRIITLYIYFENKEGRRKFIKQNRD